MFKTIKEELRHTYLFLTQCALNFGSSLDCLLLITQTNKNLYICPYCGSGLCLQIRLGTSKLHCESSDCVSASDDYPFYYIDLFLKRSVFLYNGYNFIYDIQNKTMKMVNMNTFVYVDFPLNAKVHHMGAIAQQIEESIMFL